MATYEANIEVSASNGYKFTNASNNDIVFYGTAATQQMLIGTSCNASSYANITLMNSNIGLSVMGNTSNSSINFLTNNGVTNSMTILGNGNVGIGKTNPGYPLDVNGTVNATAVYINGSALSAATGGGFAASNTNTCYTTCNVGIGKTNPAQPLDVVGNINFTGTLMQNGSAYVGSQFSNNGANIFILGSNVGIGTNTPSANLQVYNSNQAVYVRVGNSNASGDLGMAGGAANFSSSAITNDLVLRNYQGSNVLIQVGAGAASICINSNNNVGIGKTNPGYTLDVAGTGNATALSEGGTALTTKYAFSNYMAYNWNSISIGSVNYSVPTGSNIYYKIATLLDTSNGGNASLLEIRGAMGAFVSANTSLIDVSIGTRSGLYIVGSLKTSSIVSNTTASADLAMYMESNNTYSLYLKCAGFYKFDLSVKGYGTGVTSLTPAVGTVTSASFPTGSNVFNSIMPYISQMTVGSNFGINNSNPQFSLDVGGSGNFSGNVTVGSNLLLGQTVGVGGLYITKSSGCNTNITSTVVSIPGYYFNSNNSNVGINNNTPSYSFDVLGASRFLGNSPVNSPDTIIGNLLVKTYNKSLTTTALDFTNICSLSSANGALTINLDVVHNEGNSSESKCYMFAVGYVATNTTYYRINPKSSSGSYNSNDWAVEINQNGAITTLRLVRVSGTTTTANFTCTLKIHQSQSNPVSITDSTTTGSSAANSGLWSSSVITQVGGLVGINTSAPAFGLDVSGTGHFTGSLFTDSVVSFSNNSAVAAPVVGFNGGTGDKVVLYPGSATLYPYSIGVNNYTLWYSAPVTCQHVWYIGGSNVLSMSNVGTSAVLTTPGSVGIGSTTPVSKLDVNGQLTVGNDSGWGTGGIRFRSVNGTVDGAIVQGNNGGLFYRAGSNDGSNGHNFLNGGGTTYLMNIANNGNVGIGSSSPAYKLDVTGNTQFNGSVNIPSTNKILMNTNSTIGSTTASTNSDLILASYGGCGIRILGNNGNSPYVGISGSTNATSFTPAYPLDVNGNMNVNWTTTGAGAILRLMTPNLAAGQFSQIFMGTAASQSNLGLIQFYNVGGTGSGSNYLQMTMYGGVSINACANGVGINTSTPAYPLDVNGDFNTNANVRTGGTVRIDSAGNLTAVQITLSNSANPCMTVSTTSAYARFGMTTTAANFFTGSLPNDVIIRGDSTSNKILIGNGAANPSITVSSNNNVGIGMTTPTCTLDVSGQTRIYSTSIPQLMIQGTAGASGTAAAIDFKTFGNEVYPASRVSCIDDGSFGGHLVLSSKPAGSDTNTLAERMRINNNGNVGIGTNNPVYTLDVSGTSHHSSTSYFDTVLTFSNNSGTSAPTSGAIGGTGERIILWPGSSGVYAYSIGIASGTLWNSVPSSGQQFYWYAGGSVIMSLLGTGALTVTGDITAFGSVSDQRLKENVVNLTHADCLTKVQKLRPVEFDWNSECFNEAYKGTHDFGLIAQEVEAVIPQATADTDFFGTTYKTIKYERLVPLLVGAVKELANKNKELESVNATLMERLDKLEAKVNGM